MKYDTLKSYYSDRLIIRKLPEESILKLHPEDAYILSELGLPKSTDDYTFICSIERINSNELKIGEINDDSVILNLANRTVYRGSKSFYLARTIKNLNFQLYILETLWKDIIKNQRFGNYRENQNHKRYAKYFEEKLLEIDENLLKDDNIYYWGSMIESIEFGIVG